MSLALDRDEMIRVFSGGIGRWSLASAELDTFTDAETKQLLRYDPEEAKRLLREAGYASGGPSLEFMFTPSAQGDLVVSLIQLFQAQMKRVGIDIVLKPEQQSDASRKRRTGEVMLTSGILSGKSPHIDDVLYGAYHPTSSSNYSRVNDPKLNEWLEQTRRLGDPAKRRQVVRDAVRHVNEQAYQIAWYWGPNWDFWQSYVKGHYPNAGDNGNARVSPNVWLDK